MNWSYNYEGQNMALSVLEKKKLFPAIALSSPRCYETHTNIDTKAGYMGKRQSWNLHLYCNCDRTEVSE